MTNSKIEIENQIYLDFDKDDEVKRTNNDKSEKNSNNLIDEDDLEQIKENAINSLPDFINFVLILDQTFPKNPPKLLLKTNVIQFKGIILKI